MKWLCAGQNSSTQKQKVGNSLNQGTFRAKTVTEKNVSELPLSVQ